MNTYIKVFVVGDDFVEGIVPDYLGRGFTFSETVQQDTATFCHCRVLWPDLELGLNCNLMLHVHLKCMFQIF
jgi:hypothetical protein